MSQWDLTMTNWNTQDLRLCNSPAISYHTDLWCKRMLITQEWKWDSGSGTKEEAAEFDLGSKERGSSQS
jgi:hypothetical protein